MSEVEELEARIINLSPSERAKLRHWFLRVDERLWDQQIAADFKAGKFQGLIERAREEIAEGKARSL